jgi:hypothetical protein
MRLKRELSHLTYPLPLDHFHSFFLQSLPVRPPIPASPSLSSIELGHARLKGGHRISCISAEFKESYLVLKGALSCVQAVLSGDEKTDSPWRPEPRPG